MRRILVTGASHPLGRRVTDYIAERPNVERVFGVELVDRPSGRSAATRGALAEGGLELDYGGLVDAIRAHEIDSIVHCALTADRSGAADTPSAADVIGTMRLCAAANRTGPVRCLVLASSTAVYPIRSHAPLLHREEGATETAESSPAAFLLQAEEYARDVAERAPHLCVAILRLAELAGPGVHAPLASVLQSSPLPSVIGFDPPVQLLHVEDAVRALAFAAEYELAGIYNVAAPGLLRWSEVTRALGRRTLPVLPLEAGPLQPILRGLRLPHVPSGMLGLLRFGCAVDTAKLAAAGFTPKLDLEDCLGALAGES